MSEYVKDQQHFKLLSPVVEQTTSATAAHQSMQRREKNRNSIEEAQLKLSRAGGTTTRLPIQPGKGRFDNVVALQ